MDRDDYKILVIRREDDLNPIETVHVTPELLQKLKTEEIIEEDESNIQCRICDTKTPAEELNLLIINDRKSVLGTKLSHIVQTDVNDANLSVYSCSLCAEKIQSCFSLLVEIQASNMMVRQKYGQDQNEGTPPDDRDEFQCDSCGQAVQGSSNFIQHYEDHLTEDAVQLVVDKVDIEDVKEENEGADDTDTQSVASERSIENLLEMVKMELNRTDDESDTGLPEPLETVQGKCLCEKCLQVFDYKFLYLRHKCGLPGDPLSMQSCAFCDGLFSSQHLSQHALVCRKTKQKLILCNNCGKMVKAKQWLTHKANRCKLMKDLFTCKVCGDKFEDRSQQRMHCRTHFDKTGGPKGTKFLKSKNKFENKATVLSDAHCWMCGEMLDSIEELRQHLQEKHNVVSVGQESRFECSNCDKTFPDMFTLKAHLKLIHEVKDDEISKYKSCPVYRAINCNVCGSVFNSENRMRIHLKEDHGLKNFEMDILKKACEKCGKKFASKQNLIHHINSAHLNFKPMICNVCGEKFAKHSSLIYHKLRHSGEKPFQCELCNKSYRQRNDVIRHLARHVRDQQINFEEASAINNSQSTMVVKRRIFLKDSHINYDTVARKRKRGGRGGAGGNRHQGEVLLEELEMQQAEEESQAVQIIEGPMSPVYEEVVIEAGEFVRPVYDPRKNTIILA